MRSLRLAISLFALLPIEYRYLTFLKFKFLRIIDNSCIEGPISPSVYSLKTLTTLSLSTLDSASCNHSSLLRTEISNEISDLESLQVLQLRSPGLTGFFPEAIGMLRNLTHLELSNPDPGTNTLIGRIPYLGNLSNLEVFKLEGTQFTSLLPPVTAPSFPHLRDLSFANSFSLEISIDSIIKAATGLEILNIGGTLVSFKFDLLATCTQIHTLIMEDMARPFVGEVGDWFWTLTRLRYVSLRRASVWGTISPSISNLKDLTHLDLSYTIFTGRIPAEISHCDSLERLYLSNSQFSNPIPESLGDLSSLREFTFSLNLQESFGTIPSSLSKLKKLEVLELSSGSLNGTIPREFSKLRSIKVLSLDNNNLQGTIPSLSGSDMRIDLHNNRLIGTIPTSIARGSSGLDLSYNQLSGPIDPQLFLKCSIATSLDLSHNLFISTLPDLSDIKPEASIILSYNQFEGTIPGSYAQASTLQLDNNNLNGSLDELFNWPTPYLQILHLSNNELEGELPHSLFLSDLRELVLAGNKFHGDLPLVLASWKVLDLSVNQFSDGSWELWVESVRKGSLTYLDISSNAFSKTRVINDLLAANVTYISVANNKLISAIKPFPFISSVAGLDLSGNTLYGTFPSHNFPNMVSLDLSNNYFGDDLNLKFMQRLTELDISFNQFSFDVSTFSRLPFLLSINAHRNHLYGTLVLDGLRSLKTADFSHNYLNFPPDLDSIGLLYKRFSLESLNIVNNSRIQPFSTYNHSKNDLHRLQSSSPSRSHPSTVRCYELAYEEGTTFTFDEGLFSYSQCECASGYFGVPPFRCLPCPTTGSTSCYGSEIVIGANYYATLSLDYHQNPLNIGVESCIKTIEQELTKRTNCNGFTLNMAEWNYSTSSNSYTPIRLYSTSASPNSFLDRIEYESVPLQCADGTEGRLCSKCICDISGHGPCFYQKGPTCKRCNRTFKLSQSLPIVATTALVLLAVVTSLMFIIIQSRRSFNMTPWEELPLYRRIFYRLMYLSTLGNVSILITFLQILVEFTHWDVHVFTIFAQLINGEGAWLGLDCLFPLLSNPLAYQLVLLSVPFVISAFIALSVFLASILSNIWEQFKLKRRAQIDDEDDQLRDDQSDYSEGQSPLLPTGNVRSKIKLEYPAFALFTSVSITVVKFFYFGTSLAAHRYLFSEVQYFSNIIYVQNKPWMKYSAAMRIIFASIPAIIIFDLIVPILFSYLCWRVRNIFFEPRVQIYFGTLFETFSRKCFWWEIVNTIRKLGIALALRGIANSNPLQTSVVVSILAGTQLIQVSIRPWKRRIENIADSVSAILLIGALLSTRTSASEHTNEIFYYILTLSAVFICSSIVIIIYQTWNGRTDYQKKWLAYSDQIPVDTFKVLDNYDEHTGIGSETENEISDDFVDSRNLSAPSFVFSSSSSQDNFLSS